MSRPQSHKTLVQAFISCRLDYCNSLLYGVTDNVMRRVQSLQNAEARLITRARRRDHITPVLCQLHWLPVRRRVEFKLTCLGRLYLYLADDIHLVDPFGLPLITCAQCHVHTTALETEALVLSATNLEKSAAWPSN